MATLTTTSVTGTLNIGSYAIQLGNSDVSPWWYGYHCADATTTAECNPTYACGRLHVRTPIPADTTALGWNPIILHVVGYHTYSGEYTSDWKALLNVNGDNNTWYGNQILNNRAVSGYDSQPYVYKSSSTYGGKHRVCFAVNKVGCCCTGYIWVRWYNGASWFTDYPWATVALGDSQASPRAAY